MLHFVTLSDSKYLDKGYTLYRNLVSYLGQGGFMLHYLCLDSDTSDKLNKRGHENLITYSPVGPDFEMAGKLPASEYGNAYSAFCWACAPIFINYVLKNLAEGDDLLYVDSDIYFTSSPTVLFSKIRQNIYASVSIHRHRFEGTEELIYAPFDINKCIVGRYNVGVMYFKNNKTGREISEAWKSWVLDPSNKYAAEYGKCGDQGYVSLFPELWKHDQVSIFDMPGCGIAHLAPWCADVYEWKTALDVIYLKKYYEGLAFIHFSHFTYSINDKTWSSSIKGEWKPEVNSDFIRTWYEHYFKEIVQSYKLLNK